MNQYGTSFEDEMIDLDNQFNELDAQLNELENSNNKVEQIEDYEDSSDLSGMDEFNCQSDMPESSMPNSSSLDDDDDCSSTDPNEIVFSNAIISEHTTMNLQQREDHLAAKYNLFQSAISCLSIDNLWPKVSKPNPINLGLLTEKSEEQKEIDPRIQETPKFQQPQRPMISQTTGKLVKKRITKYEEKANLR